MQLVYDTDVGKVIYEDGKLAVAWSPEFAEKPNWQGACLGIVKILSALVETSRSRTIDELEDDLSELQLKFVAAQEFEAAGTIRDAKAAITNLAVHNENLRETVQRMTVAHTTKMKPHPED